VLVEMGLPAWRPADATNGAYLATYGASGANAQAAAELLGLTRPLTRKFRVTRKFGWSMEAVAQLWQREEARAFRRT
jgi:hypothetical protein